MPLKMDHNDFHPDIDLIEPIKEFLSLISPLSSPSKDSHLNKFIHTMKMSESRSRIKDLNKSKTQPNLKQQNDADDLFHEFGGLEEVKNPYIDEVDMRKQKQVQQKAEVKMKNFTGLARGQER